MPDTDALETLRAALEVFARERDWETFHTPKNLAMALSVEAAELLECFQWLTPEESAAPDAKRRQDIEHEMADVLLYLIRLADRLGVDLYAAARSKIEINRVKYPVERVRGQARKYNEYEDYAQPDDAG
ncbi:nucleotide pyrophosphohydrolase [Acidihalobacter yilgarnensis]|uniref:Nucleotide pyrophosphohydrolase n=1 Tax=Acidihalobacter yilgarnensis TaxID=2819280 RepID=A0A1D8ISF7_9GAMM|nr:nucleotide pyrophosphohydrolase [Acidihalobacter yilgarnensis]AOU99337.1 nucleotide pyrophosphohydrolase [Acidihalobacter yilgarnensis]